MPDYKKKRVRKNVLPAKKRAVKTRQPAEDISMRRTSAKKTTTPPKTTEMRVVKGKKLELMRKTRIIIFSAIFLAGVITLLSFILPVGISEAVTNTLALTGAGSYPYELYGAETLNSVSRGSYYYVLTDTNLTAQSNSGNKILTVSHGFSNPVLKTSASRALIFDQGGKDLLIYNLKRRVNKLSVEGTILNAAIARCGTYAVVTSSDTYASTVSVYSKDDRLLYEWYSAADIVNNVTISHNGKKIAVSTVNASGGQFTSKLFVFTYESANPVFTADYGSTPIYALDNTNRSGFSIITANSFNYITWSKYTKTEHTGEMELAMFRSSSSGIVLVYNRSSDKSDNRIVVLSAKGESVSEFSFNGNLSDIQIARNHIYCISDTTVSLYNKKGELLRTGTSDYGVTRIAVIGTYTVAAITNSDVAKVELSNEQE